MPITEAKSSAGAEAPANPFERSDPPLYAVTLWPHRSMTASGFRWFIGVLAIGLAMPLIGLSGSPTLLMFMAPFPLTALALVWWLVRAHDRSRRLVEELRLWPDLIAVERREPHGRILRWQSSPYWVRIDLRDTSEAQRYLTLAGGGRTIELGAFLTADERETLADALRAALRRAAQPLPG